MTGAFANKSRARIIVCLALTVLVSLCGSNLRAETVGGNDPRHKLRREISSARPLFVYSSVYSGASPNQLLNFWKILPDDVKPYFGVHVNPAKKDSIENRAWIESVLKAAEENNIPAIIEVEGFDSANDTPMSYWSELFDRYTVLIGLNISELGATGTLSGSNLDAKYIDKMIQYINAAASKGGYFIWQDMGYDWPFPKSPHVFMKAGASKPFYDALLKNGDRMIFVHKHNGNGRRATTDAAAIGYWSSGLASNWGVHSEGWLWWEGGNERLFGPSAGYKRSAEPWKSVFTYPAAQYGMEWLMGAAGGAAIFSLEAYFQGYTSCEGDRFSPAFENALLPLIRQIIRGGIIPDRQTAMSRIKAAYHPLKAADPAIRDDDLFRGLYGPVGTTQNEWLPSTGRYYYLPALPVLAGADILARYPFVFDSEYYNAHFKSRKAKKEYFDKLYPEAGKGDSWFISSGNNWLIVNPNENADIATTFEFQLNSAPGVVMSGTLSHHTFAIARERAGGISIQLSNYMIDSNADVWDNPDFNKDKVCDFIKDRYIGNPTDTALRESRIVLSGLKNENPKVDVAIGRRGEYKTARNGDTLAITVAHNGTADIEIGM